MVADLATSHTMRYHIELYAVDYYNSFDDFSNASTVFAESLKNTQVIRRCPVVRGLRHYQFPMLLL